MEDNTPWISTSELHLHPENSNEHTEEQIKRIAKGIKHLGWGRPLVISSDNYILIGNGAYRSATEILHLTKVPYRRVKYKHNEPEAIALMTSDNKLAELSDWNYGKLGSNFEELELQGFDVELTGFDEMEIDQINELIDHPTSEDEKSSKGEDGETHKLVDTFIVPPFSVLDTRQGYWMERKKKWKALICDDGSSRERVLSRTEGKTENLIDSINKGVSILDPVLCEVLLRWFANPGSYVFDPFSGDTVFGFVSAYKGYKFIGTELREEQVELNQKACDKYSLNATYIHEDAQQIDKCLSEDSRDFMFSCPPYYNLEVYSDLPEDASNQPTYEDFLKILSTAFKKSLKILKNNRFACIVVGDIRDEKGELRDFTRDIIKIFTSTENVHFYNELIIIDPVGTAPQRARKYFKNRKVVKTHQNVLVFYKGNPKEIPENFPELTEED